MYGGYKEKLQLSSQLEASVNSSRKLLHGLMPLLVPWQVTLQYSKLVWTKYPLGSLYKRVL